MIKKKVCMLGAFAAGKTSLVQRFVYSLFSDKYHTTVGVKVDKKSLAVKGTPLDLILWDIYGEDEFQEVRDSYLRGASGCLVVVDGTRRYTLDTAHALVERTRQAAGDIPFVFVFNKADLMDQWEIETDDLQDTKNKGLVVVQASAKEGTGVEAAFTTLAEMMLEAH